LADGSKVWLNAASSLRYPTSFTGKERTVELQGEGYFEIAHDATKPFRVQVNGTTVEVLGTHFNINAYNDEPQLKTTLLEGKVKIENGGVVRFLKPGQQAVVEGEGKLALVNDADVEEAVAWKNGKFIFNGNDIHSVMRQLSRWYTITVQYNGQISDDEFVGIIPIPRSENISAILSLLQKTRTVSFQVNGRNVTVNPYKN
jgi:ferric-dicitrate binding protein FerR (iron transport regulator)